MLWTLEASYFYYAHGPLARIETGQHNIQGTDYFYTLQGWIKGVNSIGLNAENDLGKDGAELSTFSKDEYAYTLNYFEGDYTARAGNSRLGQAFLQNEVYTNFQGYKDELGNATYRRESLYNGNIAAMATSIGHFGDASTQSMNYRYDQLHRIAAAEASSWTGTQWQGTNGAYRTSYKYDRNGNIEHLYRNNGENQRIDNLDYTYYDVSYAPTIGSRPRSDMQNRLWKVKDIDGTAEGLNFTNEYVYEYDLIGNLTKNAQDGIQNIEWNIYGKVEEVTKTNGTIITYKYDGTGNRIYKEVRTTTTNHVNYYLRDASGNVMAIYEDERPINTTPTDNIAIKEIPIYGSSRLGQYRPFKDDLGQVNKDLKTALGQRIYEFSNHLGNVLVTLTDNKVPLTTDTYKAIVLSASDYYPFGMSMSERTYQNSEYRYGFNGMEKDWDIAAGKTDFGARIYDEIIGKWLSLDEHIKSTQSNYAFATDNPIIFVDPDGRDDFYYDRETRSWDVVSTGGPHNFMMYVTVKDADGSVYYPVRKMTDKEIGSALFRNNTLYLKAMKSASTPEDARHLNYLVAEIFGVSSQSKAASDSKELTQTIAALIVTPIILEAAGSASVAELIEYGMQEFARQGGRELIEEGIGEIVPPYKLQKELFKVV